jgi:hypothetical protein
MLINFEHVAKYVSDVTDAQIGKCYGVYGSDDQKFYMVESEHEVLIEYKVTYSARYGFQCTCKSGQKGFWNVHHISGVCKHCRWMVACVLEERQAMLEQAQLNAFARKDTMGLVPAIEVAWHQKLGIPRQAKIEQDGLNHSRTRGRLAILQAIEESRKPYQP